MRQSEQLAITVHPSIRWFVEKDVDVIDEMDSDQFKRLLELQKQRRKRTMRINRGFF